MKKHIPNMITCCNLLSGAVAVYFATQGEYILALCMIILAAVFDFCDGLVARALGVSSEIGKELDSLADDISFGLAPAIMLFCYTKMMVGWWALIALLMAAFSALRLAKFNLDERQTTGFIGLATPANALFWASAVSNMNLRIVDYEATGNIATAVILLIMSLFSCYLLVSEIPFFSLKFHDLKWANNKTRFIFLIGAAIIIAIYLGFGIALRSQYALIPMITVVIIWYVLLAFIRRKKS